MNQKDKVLIVDDDSEILTVIKEGLEKYVSQFEVMTSTDVEKAIELLQKEYISVLITDIAMPKVDGVELLAYMSQNYPHVSCIVMTGNASIELKKRDDGEDTFGYIEKPFDINVLAWMIMDKLNRRDEGAIPGAVSISSLLQLVKMEEKTCLLEVCCGNKDKGCFYFNKGHLFNASNNGLQGEDAALKMITWDNATFQFKKLPNGNYKQLINKDLISLIMEGSRLKDEAIAQKKENVPRQIDSTEMVSKQESAFSSQHIEDDMISQAIWLAESTYFKQAQKVLTKLLKTNPRTGRGWLWYSRVTGSMKAMKSSLKNAAILRPKDPEVVEETKKFDLAEKKIWAERIRHCPFCWFPVDEEAVECQYCRSHLFIHEQFFVSIRAAEQKELEKAIERYTKVINREKNANAHYYLGMAHLNLENWEEAINQFHKAKKLSPVDKAFFSKQFNALMNFMAAMETLPEQEVFTRKKQTSLSESPQRNDNKIKILVVEDSATTRKVVSITLGQKGYEVLEAKDGLEALSKLNDDKPDLVLLDIIMPGMDGYKVLSIMKRSEEFKNIPVIMLTARDKLFDKIKGKVSGSNEYLTKPFDPDELVAKVSKYVP